jgi:hypothetical protein
MSRQKGQPVPNRPILRVLFGGISSARASGPGPGGSSTYTTNGDDHARPGEVLSIIRGPCLPSSPCFSAGLRHRCAGRPHRPQLKKHTPPRSDGTAKPTRLGQTCSDAGPSDRCALTLVRATRPPCRERRARAARRSEPGRRTPRGRPPVRPASLQVHAVGVERRSRRPVGEDSEDPDLPRQDIERHQNGSIVLQRRVRLDGRNE